MGEPTGENVQLTPEQKETVRLSPPELNTFEIYSEHVLDQVVSAFWERFCTQIGHIKNNNDTIRTQYLMQKILDLFNLDDFRSLVLSKLLESSDNPKDTALYDQNAVELSPELAASVLAKTLNGQINDPSIIERAHENAGSFSSQMKTDEQINKLILKATSDLAKDDNKKYNLILKHY